MIRAARRLQLSFLAFSTFSLSKTSATPLMKAAEFVCFLILLPLLSTSVQGQVEFKLQTNVQTPFIVSDKTLPGGDYLFIVNSGRQRLTIRGERLAVTVAAGHLVYTGGLMEELKNELIFRQYGEERFLSAVWVNNQGVSVAKSKRQKELEKKGVAGEDVKIVINRR